jgi:hypothetical protein
MIMNLDNSRDRESAGEAGATDLALGPGQADRREPNSETTPRRRRRGFGLLLFLLGLVLGVVAATIGPRYAGPYLADVGLTLPADPTLSGRVIEKRMENDRLLLRVLTEEGVSLTAFTRNLDDIDLLIGQGDRVEFGAGQYEPFLHDPSIRRVRPAEGEQGGGMTAASTPGAVAQPADDESSDAGPLGHPSQASPPTTDDRTDYQLRMENQLSELEAEIEALERRLASAGADINEAARRRLDDLRERSKAARHRLAEIRTASGHAWLDLRAGLEQAWADLRMALQEARSHFAQSEGAAPVSSSKPAPPPQGSSQPPGSQNGGQEEN